MNQVSKINRILRYGMLVLTSMCFLPNVLCGQDVEIKRERIFTGEGLYGFMNGGAEQFLEYGVSKLTTRDILYKGEEFTLDIYEMPSPADAFGIYSLHVFKCQRADTLNCIDCLSPYQLQAVAGNKYISVVFPSGSSAARHVADELIRIYIPMDKKENPEIPDILGLTSPYSGSVKYLKGPVAISGISTSLTELLTNITYTGIWFVADKPAKSYRALVFCSDEKECAKLKAKIQTSGIIRSENNYILFTNKEKEKPDTEYGSFGF